MEGRGGIKARIKAEAWPTQTMPQLGRGGP